MIESTDLLAIFVSRNQLELLIWLSWYDLLSQCASLHGQCCWRWWTALAHGLQGKILEYDARPSLWKLFLVTTDVMPMELSSIHVKFWALLGIHSIRFRSLMKSLMSVVSYSKNVEEIWCGNSLVIDSQCKIVGLR